MKASRKEGPSSTSAMPSIWDRSASNSPNLTSLSRHTSPRQHEVSRASSFLSIDSAHHADDERSSSPSWPSGMGPNSQDGDAEPSYPGEDTRPTSRRELLGFYTYSFAAEVFVVCGLGAFVPITLEDLARASPSAVRADDHSRPCKAQGINHQGPGVPALSMSKGSSAQCVFNLLGTEVNTASFAMYTFSVSVLLQALVVVTMSGAADHGRYRKILLIAFAITGSIATMLFLPITPALYLLGSLWAMIGNVCIGASFVLLNSFLPLLVRHHESARQAGGEVHQAMNEVSNDSPYTFVSPHEH